MANRDFLVSNANTIVGSGVANGGLQSGVTVTILEIPNGESPTYTTMIAGLSSIITDYSSSAMDTWTDLSSAPALVQTGKPFNPANTAAQQATYFSGLGLNSTFGSLNDPTKAEGVSPNNGSGVPTADLTKQLVIVPVTGNTKQIAVLSVANAYKNNSGTSLYRGVKKFALRFDEAVCPTAITVKAQPGILKDNCVTGVSELTLGQVVTVASC